MLEALSMYEQLQYGQLVRVYPNLVKRLKQHFSTLKECGNVGMIIGCNGYIWIVSASDQMNRQVSKKEKEKREMPRIQAVSVSAHNSGGVSGH